MSALWTPELVRPPAPVIDGALARLYREERRRERALWGRISDPRVDRTLLLAAPTVRSTARTTSFGDVGTEPTGAASGDLIVMIICNPFSGTAFTPPAGWTEVVDVAGGGGRLGAFWIIRGGSAPSYDIGGGNGSSHAIFTLAITAGTFDATTPMDATPTTTTKVGTNPDSPTITTVTADTLLIIATTNDASAQAITEPAGFTGIATIEGAKAAYKSQAATGATGVFSWTSASQTWVSMTMAVRPAGGGGGGTSILRQMMMHHGG
jgi:hypothetical protein